MHLFRLSLILLLISALMGVVPALSEAASFLFDATKSQTSGNADWTIDAPNISGNYARPERYPVPNQCLINSGTPETAWMGGYSAWGMELVKEGHHVETLPLGTSITYGDCSNEQDLSHYDVFVLSEPQSRYYDSQADAILNFVNNGGGLFLIANHCGSDRNHSNWDPPMVMNDLGTMTEFGAHFEVDEGSGTESCNFSNGGCNNFRDDPSDPILHGPYGDCNPIGFHSATTMTIFSQYNSSIRPLAWKNSEPQGDTMVALARCTYGTGRVVLIGDSAPADDGTGDPDDDLINGWQQNWRLFMNASHWLSQVPGMAQYTACPGASPTPTCAEGTATPTPTTSASATPSPTPEATYPFDITVDINLNALEFSEGEPFLLTIFYENYGNARMVDQYVILEVYGAYYFHPSWGVDLDLTNRPLLSGSTGPDTVLDFAWPPASGGITATFWGAVTEEGNINALFDYDRVTFNSL